jgi:hypothetical protein
MLGSDTGPNPDSGSVSRVWLTAPFGIVMTATMSPSRSCPDHQMSARDWAIIIRRLMVFFEDRFECQQAS